MARVVEFAEDPLPDVLPARTGEMFVELLHGGDWLVSIGRADGQDESGRQWRIGTDRAVLTPHSPWFQTFHAELRSLIRSLVTMRDTQKGEFPSVSLGPLTVGAMPFGLQVSRAWTGSRMLMRLSGFARDLLWFTVLSLIGTAGVDRLMQCDCQRVFAKTGRREFCSVRCQKRVYMREKRSEERRAARQTTNRGRHGKTTRKR